MNQNKKLEKFLKDWTIACEKEYFRKFQDTLKNTGNFFKALEAMDLTKEEVVDRLKKQPQNFDEMIEASQQALKKRQNIYSSSDYRCRIADFYSGVYIELKRKTNDFSKYILR